MAFVLEEIGVQIVVRGLLCCELEHLQRDAGDSESKILKGLGIFGRSNKNIMVMKSSSGNVRTVVQ